MRPKNSIRSLSVALLLVPASAVAFFDDHFVASNVPSAGSTAAQQDFMFEVATDTRKPLEPRRTLSAQAETFGQSVQRVPAPMPGAAGTERTPPKPFSAQQPTSAVQDKAVFASTVREAPWLLRHLSLRDTLTPGSKKGAVLGITRSEGDTSYHLRLGAALNLGQELLPRSWRDAGWSWGAGLQVDKNTSAKPTDGRLVQLGANGLLFADSPAIVDSRVSLQAVQDRVAETRSYALRYDGALKLERPILEYGRIHSPLGSGHWIYPLFGFYVDRVSKAQPGEQTGTAPGGYVGFNASYYPGGALWPVHLFARATRMQDFRGLQGEPKRSATMYDYGVTFVFVDPREPNRVVPGVSLQRRLGANYLDGITRTDQTSLVFTLRIN